MNEDILPQDFLRPFLTGRFVDLRALHPRDKRQKKQEFFPSNDLGGAVRFIERYRSTHNLYLGVAERESPQDGTKRTCSSAHVLWVDLDFDHTPEDQANFLISAFPLRPSIINRSGGGYHLYWLLRSPYNLKASP